MAISKIMERYTDLLTFYQEWVPKIAPETTVYVMGQAAPRPPLPYIGFRPIAKIERVGFDEHRIAKDGTETLRGQRIITSLFTAYTDSKTRFNGFDTAWALLQELRFSLGYPWVYEELSSKCFRVLDEGEVENTSETLNTTNEPRATWAFTLSTAIAQPIDSGEILTINAEGRFEDVISNISSTKP
jgi:hypothetical protein